MTRRAFLIPLIVVLGLTLVEPVIPTHLFGIRWLVDFTPLLIVYACVRFSSGTLFGFLVLGSLGVDFLVGDRPGTSPLLWALVAFLVRSQRLWIRNGSWVTIFLMSFAASFLYALADRTFFLMVNDLWTWSYLLLLKLLGLATVNAALAPGFFALLDRICGLQRAKPSDRDFSMLYATR
ncbi:MAG: hypothetical protein OHK005_02770 [Candidatus Methylacidiphilales bacterium]